MSRIIHVQTTINTIFAELDADGNVGKKFPISVDVPKIDQDIFIEAAASLASMREKLVAQVRGENTTT